VTPFAAVDAISYGYTVITRYGRGRSRLVSCESPYALGAIAEMVPDVWGDAPHFMTGVILRWDVWPSCSADLKQQFVEMTDVILRRDIWRIAAWPI
jgi:hypothetical protein